jgi:glycosyltransferase involved in cell wall biosynthesis
MELSVVIPVYNSSRIFPELYKKICATLNATVRSFEIIAVLDGCTDTSYDVIHKLHVDDGRIRIIELSRNFGHQAAITAGLEFASGEMVAIMDDDFEDPPELLPTFISRLREGFDVVYGIRRKRKRSLLIRALFSSFYRMLDKFVDIRIPQDAGDFCIMKKSFVKILNEMPETNRFLRGLRAWPGFSQTGIEYERGERFSGESGYSLRKYLRLAIDGIFSFSYKPLIYISLAGLLIASLSFLLGISLIVLKLAGKVRDVPGWTSLAVIVLFLSGVQITSMGIVGTYIARIYDEVKRRPKYVIRRTVGLERKKAYDGRMNDFLSKG